MDDARGAYVVKCKLVVLAVEVLEVKVLVEGWLWCHWS